MYAVNVGNLKKNPYLALRQARQEPVLILKDNKPDALLLHLNKSITNTEKSLLPALAAMLYREGTLSLGGAAKLSSLAMIDFIQHLDSLGIEIVTADETVEHETRDVSVWLKS